MYNNTGYDLSKLFAKNGFLPRMIHSVEGNYKYVFNRKPAVNFVRKADALCLEEVSFTDDQAQMLAALDDVPILILVMYLIDLVERWITDDKICQDNKIDLNLV